MAEPDHPIAAHGAAPHRAVLRPSLRSGELASGETLRDPPVVREERQVDVHERVGRGEALPRGGDTAKTIDDPLISAEEVGVYLQVLVVGNPAPARSELDGVERIQRQSRHLGQAPGEHGLPAARVPEHRDLPHAVIRSVATERGNAAALRTRFRRATLFNRSSSSPRGTWPTALNNPRRSIAQGPRWGGSGEQVGEELAQLWRASERLAERSEIAFVDDQGNALEAAAVIVGA